MSEKLHQLKQKLEATIKDMGYAQTKEMEWSEIARRKSAEAAELQVRIDNFKGSTKDIDISDHAVVRYFERVLKIDIENLKKQILPPDKVQMLKGLVRGKNYVKAGINTDVGQYTVVMLNGIVVTVTV